MGQLAKKVVELVEQQKLVSQLTFKAILKVALLSLLGVVVSMRL